MKIVVLDGYTLNPGDLDWKGIEQLGELHVYDENDPSKVLERADGAEILLTNKTILGEKEIAALPKLKYIGVLATGYNVVDIPAATKRGIVVTNIPSYGTMSVAQFVFALLLELCHNVRRHSDSVTGGKWASSQHFCYWEHSLIELSGKIMGIVGFGRIGKQVAKISQAMGMKIMVYDINQISSQMNFQVDQVDYEDFSFVELDELLKNSDVVTLHCPLTDESLDLINSKTLGLMKKTAFLINTARGPLVNQEDLAKALNNGDIAGAALDVLTVEPPDPNNPLLSVKNCIITPHIAWATKEARRRLMDIATENLCWFLKGKPVNTIL